MPFAKMECPKYPPRQWAIVGYPGSGKSTFAAQMKGPILVVDADHRFAEVLNVAGGPVYSVSENAADHADPRRIADLLRQNMPGSGVRTVVIDSLTAIVAPLVTAAIMANDAGENKNRIAAFKDKALAVRTLQDGITAWGTDCLWIYHYRDTRDAQAREKVTTTVSTVELARLRRSLNLILSIVEEGGRRGVHVDWARRGRSGLTLWDETGRWANMPERIEAAVYDGLSEAEQEQIEKATPSGFAGPQEAIAWGFERGAFKDAVHARNAYEKLKGESRPKSAGEMWELWIAEVERRLVETEEVEPAAEGEEGTQPAQLQGDAMPAWQTWQAPQDAYDWALAAGMYTGEKAARAAFATVVSMAGGKLNQSNLAGVFQTFYDEAVGLAQVQAVPA